jgi:signal transduction histidine kinase
MPGRRELGPSHRTARTDLVIIGGALAVAAGTTAVVLLVPQPSFGSLTPILSAVADAVTGSVSLIAAALIYGRFRTRGTSSDLVLAAALLLFGLSDLGLSVVQQVLSAGTDRALVPWAGMIGRTVAAMTLLVAAVWNPTSRRRISGDGWSVLGGAGLVVLAIAIAVWLAAPLLPEGVHLPVDLVAGPDGPLLRHPLATTLQTMGLLAFAAAAVGFWRRANRTAEPHLTWLAAASIIGAAARLNYLLVPTFPVGLYYSGDLLRLAFAGMVAVVAAHELEAQWRQLATVRVLEERRAIARDLHDTLAQELAYVSATTATLAQRADDPTLDRVAAAAQRALDEARVAIAQLTRPLGAPFAGELAAVVEEVAHRAGVPLVLDLDEAVEPAPEVEEALLRIAREAVTNAVRHAQPEEIVVALRGSDDRPQVRIEDDGTGFDPEHVDAGRFGLTSMRERATSIGADLQVRSAPGRGTTVEVEVA